MRRRARDSMGMNETDLLALRFLLQADRSGEGISPKELSRKLGISTASTTTLIDRLVRRGHACREDNPTDRRALVIRATATSNQDVRNTLGDMHARMVEVADQLSPAETAVVAGFLDRMRAVLDDSRPD